MRLTRILSHYTSNAQGCQVTFARVQVQWGSIWFTATCVQPLARGVTSFKAGDSDRHSDALTAPPDLGGCESDVLGYVSLQLRNPGLRLQQVAQEECDVGWALSQAPHEVGIPLLTIGHVGPHPVALGGELALQARSYAVQHLELKVL
jgi:hypothetical protein